MTISAENKPPTVYDFLKSRKELLPLLVRAGYLSKLIARDMKIYEQYLQEDGRMMARCKILAERHNMHPLSVYRIVKNLTRYL